MTLQVLSLCQLFDISYLCLSISSPVVYPIFVFLVFVRLFHHQLCILSLFFSSVSVYFITSCVSYLCFSCLCPSISSPVVYPIFVFLVCVCLFHHQLCILSLFFWFLSVHFVTGCVSYLFFSCLCLSISSLFNLSLVLFLLSVYFITSCVSYLYFSGFCLSISSPGVYPIFIFLVFVCPFHHQVCILSFFFLSLSVYFITV
jgi:hypothetical protein